MENSATPKPQGQKPVQPKTQPKVDARTQQSPLKSAQLPQQPQPQTNNNQVDLRGFSKRFGLVFYEVAKEKNSSFTDDQKQPVKISAVGVFMGLTAGTLLNMAQLLIKPSQKYRKIFFLTGVVYLTSSLFLGAYGFHKVTKLYELVPEAQWTLISAQKQIYDKLGFEEQKKFLGMVKQENQEQKKTESGKQENNTDIKEKIDLVK